LIQCPLVVSNLVSFPFILWHFAFTAVCLALLLFIFPFLSLSLCRFVCCYVDVPLPEVQHRLTHTFQQCLCRLVATTTSTIAATVVRWTTLASLLLFPPRLPLFLCVLYFLLIVSVFSRPWLSLLDNSLSFLFMQFPTLREQLRSVGQSDFLANIFRIVWYNAGGEILLRIQSTIFGEVWSKKRFAECLATKLKCVVFAVP